ncbi:MAG TPA: ISL3 family transposase [Kofleriaceae bacterium]|nr:ISL3 family transposase [Kofleriaceae bacterium]
MLDVDFEQEGLVVDVAPTWRRGRCSACGEQCPGYDRERGRRWRHLDLAGMTLHLRYDTRRVECPRCGVKVERVPWAETSSWFTRPFEDHVGYLAQRCDKTTVSDMMRVAWDTVGSIIQRVVARRQRPDVLDGLTHIGVDELSYRRHHEYITVVVDHKRGHVVWAQPGKNADTLKAFFDELGTERCGKLEAVTIDMSGAYIKAVTECSPQAQIIFDRFHVQRLVQDAVDEVRRDEARAATSDEERKELKGTRWPLLKSFWNLSLFETNRLAALQRDNKRLYRAYLLKEAMVGVLDCRADWLAEQKLDEWIRWARRSRLEPFKRLAATIREHADGILAYVRSGLSNGRTEGLNGKARTITRRSYGFHSAHGLIALLKLCCSGIHLYPVHHWPGSTH